eukprot:151440_1
MAYDADTDIITYCHDIKLAVKARYPYAYDVWCEAPKETIAHLKAKGIIKAQQCYRTFPMKTHEGTDNIATWKEYEHKIYEFLTITNDDDRLKKQRKALATEIWKQHYKEFPKWPSVSKKQQSETIYLSKKDNYTEGDWIIFWSAGGHLKVTDLRPSKYEYKTRFEGKPRIRVLQVDWKRFSKFNQLCLTDGVDQG